jgi:hypothetical protein
MKGMLVTAFPLSLACCENQQRGLIVGETNPSSGQNDEARVIQETDGEVPSMASSKAAAL